MLREITNRLVGRRKSVDKSLSVNEAIDLLRSLNGPTRANIRYDGGAYFTLSNVAPREMADFVRDKFSISGHHYSNIKHQVYSGESGKKHYLELARGNIEGRFGAIYIKGRPFRIATIDFLVQE